MNQSITSVKGGRGGASRESVNTGEHRIEKPAQMVIGLSVVFIMKKQKDGSFGIFWSTFDSMQNV